MFIELFYKIRCFLIQLLAGHDLQVMINIKFVDGTAMLDEGHLVSQCEFTTSEQEATGRYENKAYLALVSHMKKAIRGARA